MFPAFRVFNAGAKILIHRLPGFTIECSRNGTEQENRWNQNLNMPWMEQLQSANWTQASSIALGAYILGCFTTGYYLVRLCRGADIRELGSGNVGAKNVGRTLGWIGFTMTLVGDLAKGALVVTAARYFTKDDRLVVLAMLAVVAGHVWPVQLRFRGGKGMATSLGVLMVYDPHLAAAFVILFLCACCVLRRMVLPGLFAFACLPLASMYQKQENTKLVGISILAGLVLITHRKNLIEEFRQLVEREDVHPKPNRPEL